MITKLIDMWIKWAERRAIKKLGGIPLLWVIYKKDKPKPNVMFHAYPGLEQDLYLVTRFKEIADYVRENWEELQNDRD